MFQRRIGSDPHLEGTISSGKVGCPDIWELKDGSFAVIGIDRTADLLPQDAGCGPDERIVVIDRHVLVREKPDIPAV